MDWNEILTKDEKAFLKFWMEKRGDRPMPRRRDFVAEDLWPWLGWIHLLRPIDDGADFVYDVFSSRTSPRAQKSEMTGRRVSEWGDFRREYALTSYGLVYRTGVPVYQSAPERYDRDWLGFSRVFVPLGYDGAVHHILTLVSEQKSEDCVEVPPTEIVLDDVVL